MWYRLSSLHPSFHTNPGFSFGDFKAVPEKYRTLIPEYIKADVPLNTFAA